MAVTTTPLGDPKVKERDRSIDLRWLVREEPMNDDDSDGFGPWQVYAELTVSHHGRAEYHGRPDRCYTAILSRHREAHGTTGNNLGVTRMEINFGGPRALPPVRIMDPVSAPRFNRKRMLELANTARAALELALSEGAENAVAIFDPAQG